MEVEKGCWKKSALASTDCCQVSVGTSLGHLNQSAPRRDGSEELNFSMVSTFIPSEAPL